MPNMKKEPRKTSFYQFKEVSKTQEVPAKRRHFDLLHQLMRNWSMITKSLTKDCFLRTRDESIVFKTLLKEIKSCLNSTLSKLSKKKIRLCVLPIPISVDSDFLGRRYFKPLFLKYNIFYFWRIKNCTMHLLNVNIHFCSATVFFSLNFTKIIIFIIFLPH